MKPERIEAGSPSTSRLRQKPKLIANNRRMFDRAHKIICHLLEKDSSMTGEDHVRLNSVSQLIHILHNTSESSHRPSWNSRDCFSPA